jgi:predicted RNase H-like nuclease (RuvC/YqgF family)
MSASKRNESVTARHLTESRERCAKLSRENSELRALLRHAVRTIQSIKKEAEDAWNGYPRTYL